MGIPLYFKQIVDDYPYVLIQHLPEQYKKVALFLDYNCAIHPCCQAVLKRIANDKTKYTQIQMEEMFVTEIITYTKTLCNLFLEGDVIVDTLMISIDGIAPQAKMVQQRSRRFRSVLQKKEMKDIDESFNVPPKTNVWDTNAITPGTQFMYNLSKVLTKALKIDPFFKQIQYRIISDASVPGEGEHKIVQYLRETRGMGNDDLEDYATIIYGLDADLTMLAMATKYKNIYLLREAVHFGKVQEDEFRYLDVPEFKNSLYNELIECLDEGFLPNIEKDNLIQDYIFLCFFIGNDFLPRLPALHIKHGAIDYLVDLYKELLCDREEYLVNDGEINIGFLKAFLRAMKPEEQRLLGDIHTAHSRSKFYKNTRLNEYDQAVNALEKLPLAKKARDVIRPGVDGWKERYYYRLFHLKNINKNKEPVKEICQLFLNGLVWTTSYYFKGCPAWNWAYYYNYAPCLDEIIETLDGMTSLKTDAIFSEPTEPVQPFWQLLAVLPPQSANLLPPKYADLMTKYSSPIIQYYPVEVTLDMHLQYRYYYCEPHLPFLYMEDIIDATEGIKLTKKEEKINAVNRTNVIFKEYAGKTVLLGEVYEEESTIDMNSLENKEKEKALRKRINDKKISYINVGYAKNATINM
jgi:5'-3' exoribonuclease 1